MITITQTHVLATDRCFDPLQDYLIATTGLSYYHNRNSELADHVARRLTCLGITDCANYLQLLQSGSDGEKELDTLIEDLTIGETFFFRHTDLFAALEQTILPDAIANNQQHRRLRIWSAGSSIGAEAYSVSILLRRHLAHRIRDWDITIIGTDINRSFLSRAANARFEDWALRGISEEIRQQCFSRQGKFWALKPEFKEGVSFQYHNLARHPLPSVLHNLSAFDVILCRNVMIYFSQPVIEGIVRNMRNCLVGGGWLLVGHAEHSLELFRDFRTVNFQGATAYQLADGPNSAEDDVPQQSASFTTPIAAPRPLLTLPSNPAAAKSPHRPPTGTAETADGLPGELASIRSLADRGEIEVADAACRKLLQTHKLKPVCHLYHALVLEQLGQYASCEQALRHAIYLDRNLMLAHYYLGLTLLRLGRRADAARSLRNTHMLLVPLEPGHVIADSDGLTAGELDEMTRMQLDAIES